MAWMLRARPPIAELTFGRLARATDAGLFEGTWVGGPDELGALRSTTTFGSGVLVDRTTLNIVPPGRMLEGVYICQRARELLASNSLVGLLVAADLHLDPRVSYPPLFNASVDGDMHAIIPTTTDPAPSFEPLVPVSSGYAEWLARRVEQRKLALGVLEPKFGSLLLRWAISVVRPRYE